VHIKKFIFPAVLMDNQQFFTYISLLPMKKNTPVKAHAINQRQAKKIKQREAEIRKNVTAKQQQNMKKELVHEMHRTIQRHFPELFNWMRDIDDCRKKASTYELAALLTACLAMFLFKSGSRNEYNQNREDVQFKKNYKRLFGFEMPHGDSVQKVIKLLKSDSIEQLKQRMVQNLFARKTFHSSRFRGHWFRVAVDASGIGSYQHQRDEQCLHRTSKKGKTSYFHSVLEARLITQNGFSISIATEWIENPEGGEYDKQDCERNGFSRLAVKLKKMYPRLPLLILADGLYPYEGFFAICKANDWAYCVTFKEGNLPTVWQEVLSLQPLQKQNTRQEIAHLPDGTTVAQVFQWVTNASYKGYTLQWLECRETITPTKQGATEKQPKTTRFVHITDLPINAGNIVDTSRTGRLRWKIENEGFNTLKNGGYVMEHQYARKSYLALKNYFQFMQMAHIINQLMTLNSRFQETFMTAKNHPTLKNLWLNLVAVMQWTELDEQELKNIANTRRQFRFSS
jgi:hypothetical protein